MEGRAVWFTSARKAEILQEPLPALKPDEVLVQATTSLISSGTEMVVYRGETVPGSPMNAMSKGSYEFPIKYGYQVVGRVVDAGVNSTVRIGARVFARHPHQDLFVIPTRDLLVMEIPEALDEEASLFINQMEVALNAHLDVPVRVGDVVVVYGQGVIGMLIARLARRNAGRLIVVDPIPMRRQIALKYGAHFAVHPDDLWEAVNECTGRRGVDIVFEASGSPSALQSAIELTGKEGTICAVSYYGSREVKLRLAPEFHWQRLRIISSHTGMVGSGLQPRWDRERRMQVGMELLAGFDVSEMITLRVPFEQASESFRLIDMRPQDFLGIVLQYPGNGTYGKV